MKKAITILTAALLLVSALVVPALATEDEAAPMPLYMSVTGKVTDITEYVDTEEKPVEDWFFINIAFEDEGVATLFVTNETYYPFSADIAVGDTVTGYYRSDMPMIMIYPPRYSVAVLVADMPEAQSVKIDRFTVREGGPEGYLVSDDNTLAITLGGDTQIVTPDGEEFDGDMDGRSLVVIYDVSTRSIPAQTTPIKVTVLPEDVETEYVQEPVELDVEDMPIIVNGGIIDAPDAFMEGEVVMVPLRAIAEELGFTVTWHGETRTVTLDSDIALTIGDANCRSDGGEILLAAAPVIVDDRTYVPIHFFKDAAKISNAYVFEGQIVIDLDGEIME